MSMFTDDTAEAAEAAGAVEHYLDPSLYDRSYRHRRADINFYRLLAEERLGLASNKPLLEMACGSGRITVPLLRSGHSVLAFDHAGPMLSATAARIAKLPAAHRRRCQLFRADMRAFSFNQRLPFVLAGFHSIQHLVSDRDLIDCFRNVRACLEDGGWFVFDVLPPHPEWLSHEGELRWSPRMFTHPRSAAHVRYGTSHRYDQERKALHMRLHYQPVDEQGVFSGAPQVVRLCHRQFWPGDLDLLLEQAGLRVLARYSAFNTDATETAETLTTATDEHIYVARPHVSLR